MSVRLSRRAFLSTVAAGAAGVRTLRPNPTSLELDAVQIAKRHSIVREGPTPGFFEGMLLGNGDIGLCVTVRPDGLGLHLGKEDSWDIRVSEDHYPHVLSFRDLLKLWERASQEAKRQGKPDLLFLENNIDFFRDYTEKVASSYRKSWPRPWPCGIVWIHWDSRRVRVARQELDISSGLLTIELVDNDLRGTSRQVIVHIFVTADSGHISVSTNSIAPFVSMAYYPYLELEAKLPSPKIDAARHNERLRFWVYQHFPAIAPTEHLPNPPEDEHDRNFFLSGQLSGEWEVQRLEESQEQLRSLAPGSADTLTRYAERPRIFCRSTIPQIFRLDLVLMTPRDHKNNRNQATKELERLAALPVSPIQAESEKSWKAFWSKSAVSLEDQELERIWYHNQYFLACCLKPAKVAPGLFGNWMSEKIGTAWHGDYHMNYNTQQVYWGVFSSNHVEQHLPYVELVESLLGYSEAYAREKFGLPGAFFPHTAYPVPSQTIPYPVPPWGYEICETPWTVQSLWWHYRYTLDRDFLERVYPLLKAATQFMVAYLKKGPDGKYHIVPTVSPENWGFTVDQRLNKDCIIDLALTEFLFDAMVQASQVLGKDLEDRARWKEIRGNIASYPRASGPYGDVWVDVVDAPAEVVYNVPITLAPVFPGEQVGIGQRADLLEIGKRTARTIRLEGGNDLVYLPLNQARLGMLNFEEFKREVRYSLLPNGACGDRVRQIDGRYRDSTNFDFMMPMGIWIENLSLPAVINECLLQSYSGVIRLFPNSQRLGAASFRNLRAAGAFLVSAAYDGTRVVRAEIYSEKGAECHLASPWEESRIQVIQASTGRILISPRPGAPLIFPTEPGQRYRIQPT